MSKPLFGLSEQQARRRELLGLLERYHLQAFDREGHYNGPPGVEGTRERLWFALSFIASDSPGARETANVIIESTVCEPCHFAPMVSIQLLKRYAGRLTAKSQQLLRGYVAHVIDNSASDDMDFVGVNDNYPCMSTFITLIGGRLLGRPELAAIGEKRLRQLQSLLTRRGFASEFNSPTYTAVQLLALAEIANCLEDGELKRLAMDCEERIWADQLGHLHLPTSQVAGPYSRAYTVDSVGHTHQSRYVLYALLGDRLPIHPVNTLFASAEGEPGEEIHHCVPFMQVSAAWIVHTDYHCPEELVRHALNKPYPYEVSGTTEFSSSSDAHAWGIPADPALAEDIGEYAAGAGTITTYMTEDYALGTAVREYHNGQQTDSFHLLYRRTAEAVRQRDIRAVYARYIMDGRKPGQTNEYGRMAFSSEASLLWDEGRKLAFQHRNIAMALYKPKRYGRLGAASLKLSLIIPCHYGEPDEIRLGERKLDGMIGESVEPCVVFVKDGPVCAAFHPLLLTNHGRRCAVRVEKANGYITVSFYNYEGEARDFDASALLLTGNGFVAEVASEAEAGGFEAFRAAAGRAVIRDETFANMHSRGTTIRRTSFAKDGVSLACEYSPVSEGIKLIEINGKAPACERLSMTGYDAARLPFLQ